MPDKNLFFLQEIKNDFEQQTVPPKTMLLREGEIARNLFYIEKGCLRLYFCDEGKDITFQFFFEESVVASFDSLFDGKPSLFSLESIESTTIRIIGKKEFYELVHHNPEARLAYERKLIDRFHTYQKLFLSRIKNTPRQRYEELLREYPAIVQRVPQHYIASYLGITPVSLSRIRNRRS